MTRSDTQMEGSGAAMDSRACSGQATTTQGRRTLWSSLRKPWVRTRLLVLLVVVATVGSAPSPRLAQAGAQEGYGWSRRAINLTTADLLSVDFADLDRGVAVGASNRDDGLRPIRLSTSDGGSTWRISTGPQIMPSGTLHGVARMPESGAVAVGAPSQTDPRDALHCQYGGQFNFDCDVRVSEAGRIVTSDDGGRSWSPRVSALPLALYGVAMADSDRGYAVGEGGYIVTTVDGGLTWTWQDSGTTADLKGVAVVTAEIAIAVGADGTVLRTTDGGRSWMTQVISGTTADLSGVASLSGTTVVAVGDNGTVVTSPDGGVTWSTKKVGTANLNEVAVADAKIAYVAGDDGLILKSVDAGKTWWTEDSGTDGDLHGIAFPNPDEPGVGYAVGEDGIILRRGPPPPRPSISSLDPDRGPHLGFYETTITGSHLGAVMEVAFGKKRADFMVVSDTVVKARTPEHPPGPVTVTVSSPGGTSPFTPQATYRYEVPVGGWTACGGDQASADCPTSPRTPRMFHVAARLDGTPCQDSPVPAWCGKVLIAGGVDAGDWLDGHSYTPLASTELYDPTSGTWMSCGAENADAVCPGPLNTVRAHSTISVLPDGRVLVAGGTSEQPTAVNTVEVYDPTTGQWAMCESGQANRSCPGPMVDRRVNHSATLMDDGRILVAGGGTLTSGQGTHTSVEIYDPGAGTWTETGSLSRPLQSHTATRLAGPACDGEDPPDYCGRILVAGGEDLSDGARCSPCPQDVVELYDPATELWHGCPKHAATSTCPAPLEIKREKHTATRLQDGTVLIASGEFAGSSVEAYEPTLGTWRHADPVIYSRGGFRRAASALLENGSVLVVGGDRMPCSESSATCSAEVYDPLDGAWRLTPEVPAGGEGHTATRLEDGRVLVVSDTAALYSPPLAVDGISPRQGPLEGGTAVEITGTGLAGVEQVTFGDKPATNVTAHSSSRITAVSPPAGDALQVEVTVTTAGGSVTAPRPFVYTGSPGGIEDLTATALSGSEVQLSFSAPGSTGPLPPPAGAYVVKQSRTPISEESFEQARSLCGGVCQVAAENVGDPLTVSVSGLKASTTYHYAVKARDEEGRLGPLSNGARVTTLATSPGRVADLAATALSGSQIRLQWSAVGTDGARPPPAAEYVVKQARAPVAGADAFREATTLCECSFDLAEVGEALTVTVTDLDPGTTYHYAVRARGPDGSLGPVSNPAAATTPGTAQGMAPGAQRLAGPHRIATSVATSRALHPQDGSAGGVVLARGDDPAGFADALAGTPLARAVGGPLLITPPRELHAAVAAEIRRVLGEEGTVVLLGGEQALAAEVEQAVAELGYATRRIAGPTRIETALAVAEALGEPATLFVTTAYDFPDALVAGAVAAHRGGAVLLSPGEGRHPATDAYLDDHPGATLVAIGGPAARAYPEARGVFGPSREDTAVQVARAFFDQPQAVGVARRDVFADALSGGVHAAAQGGPLLLTAPKRLHPALEGWLCGQARSLSRVTLYGGETAISGDVERAVAARASGRGCP